MTRCDDPYTPEWIKDQEVGITAHDMRGMTPNRKGKELFVLWIAALHHFAGIIDQRGLTYQDREPQLRMILVDVTPDLPSLQHVAKFGNDRRGKDDDS